MGKQKNYEGDKPITKWSQAVGNPDDWDKENIKRLINNWDRKHPGMIAAAIRQGREDPDTSKGNSALGRHVMELPAGLVTEIEESYPTFFQDQEHFHWFMQHFKSLVL